MHLTDGSIAKGLVKLPLCSYINARADGAQGVSALHRSVRMYRLHVRFEHVYKVTKPSKFIFMIPDITTTLVLPPVTSDVTFVADESGRGVSVVD